ncbi:hypothetical protein [Roseovarius aestuariivivens]|uniref:hypothetical protein n=1 Tax=Roseovarius aestuariivivens TaxID=1888910 RepID=UPI001080C770|nr:hypothetical protein [Roseovarius aestuariivivens]
MILNFTPQRGDHDLSVERHGDRLVLNGQEIDLSDLAEGETRSAEEIGNAWIAGRVQRQNGQLTLTLIVPHGAGDPVADAPPAPLQVAQDGLVPLPAKQSRPGSYAAARAAAKSRAGSVSPCRKDRG